MKRFKHVTAMTSTDRPSANLDVPINEERLRFWLLLPPLLLLLMLGLAQMLERLKNNTPPPALCTQSGIDRNSLQIQALSQAVLHTSVAASCGHLDAPFDILGLDVHTGIDFPMPMDAPVYSATDGFIEKVSNITGQIAVRLEDQRLVNYFHLNTLSVSENTVVHKGQYLGTVGEKGIATGPHLHIEVRVGYTGSAGLAGISCGGRCSLAQVMAMTQNPVLLLGY